MQRVKAHELRSKDETGLVAELTKQRKDLAALRVSKVSSQPQVKLSKIRVSFCCNSDFANPLFLQTLILCFRLSERPLPEFSPSSAKRESALLARLTRMTRRLLTILDTRRPEHTAESSLLLKPKNWLLSSKRSTTTSRLESTHSSRELVWSESFEQNWWIRNLMLLRLPPK